MPNVILDWDPKFKKGVIVSDFLDLIREHFSVENANAKFLKMRLGPFAHVPARKYAISPTGRFEIGMFFEIVKHIKAQESQYDILITDLIKNQVLNGYDIDVKDIINLVPSKPLREYQREAIEAAMKFGMGNIVVGTAGGKTLIMATLVETARRADPNCKTVLVILPAQLVDQTYNDFVEYGIPSNLICKWGGKNELQNTPIIIASSKTLETSLVSFRKMKDEDPTRQRVRLKAWKKAKMDLLKQLGGVSLVLIDEVHGLRKDNIFNEIIDLFPTPHKFGFTGTMPEEKIDEWNIIGKIGPIIKEVTSVQLRAMNFISQAHSTHIHIHYDHPDIGHVSLDTSPVAAYKEECGFIYNNEYRNKVISKICGSLDNNVLILINSLEHGKVLYEKLLGENPEKKVYYIRGEVPNHEREVVRRLMEVEKNVICIAMSKIFSTGINITNIHYVLFALAGKAKVRLLQSIGRGLRLHENKYELEIFDIVDELEYGRRHFVKRMYYYNKEKIPYVTKNLRE